MTRPPFTCRRDERGSISVWFAAASFAMVILVGLVVDVGGKVQAQQHARAAATAYLQAAGVEGTVAVTDATVLTVRTTDTYKTKFLGIIGLDNMAVTGEGSARLIQTQGGQP